MPEQRIRYRLIGARYELSQALRDADDLPLDRRWREEVQLAEHSTTRALALMEQAR